MGRGVSAVRKGIASTGMGGVRSTSTRVMSLADDSSSSKRVFAEGRCGVSIVAAAGSVMGRSSTLRARNSSKSLCRQVCPQRCFDPARRRLREFQPDAHFAALLGCHEPVIGLLLLRTADVARDCLPDHLRLPGQCAYCIRAHAQMVLSHEWVGSLRVASHRLHRVSKQNAVREGVRNWDRTVCPRRKRPLL